MYKKISEYQSQENKGVKHPKVHFSEPFPGKSDNHITDEYHFIRSVPSDVEYIPIPTQDQNIKELYPSPGQYPKQRKYFKPKGSLMYDKDVEMTHVNGQGKRKIVSRHAQLHPYTNLVVREVRDYDQFSKDLSELFVEDKLKGPRGMLRSTY